MCVCVYVCVQKVPWCKPGDYEGVEVCERHGDVLHCTALSAVGLATVLTLFLESSSSLCPLTQLSSSMPVPSCPSPLLFLYFLSLSLSFSLSLSVSLSYTHTHSHRHTHQSDA